jgi:hypothetical protein
MNSTVGFTRLFWTLVTIRYLISSPTFASLLQVCFKLASNIHPLTASLMTKVHWLNNVSNYRSQHPRINNKSQISRLKDIINFSNKIQFYVFSFFWLNSLFKLLVEWKISVNRKRLKWNKFSRCEAFALRSRINIFHFPWYLRLKKYHCDAN